MEHYISRDKTKLDIQRIHSEIGSTYWGLDRTLEETLKTIKACICFGLYDRTHSQIGYTRLLTDRVTFAYLMDVIIFDPHKGKGLGKALVGHILDSREVRDIKTVALKTLDAHGLYESFGFKPIGASDIWMAIDRTKYTLS